MEQNYENYYQQNTVKNEKVPVAIYLKNLLFFAYFVILSAERVQSIVRSYFLKVRILNGGLFNTFVFTVSIVSLIIVWTYLLTSNKDHFIGLFTRGAKTHEKINFKNLSVAAGILLVSGMLRTHNTIVAIQYVAFAVLVLAMVIQTIESETKNCGSKWLSLVYAVAFLLTIPAVNKMLIDNAKLKEVFYVIEAISSISLVGMFTYYLVKIFTGDGENLFNCLAMVVMVVANAMIIWLRWDYVQNYFLLAMTIVTFVIWFIGKVAVMVAKKKNN